MSAHKVFVRIAIASVASVIHVEHVSAATVATSLGISASNCEPVMPLQNFPEGAEEMWQEWMNILNEALEDEANVKEYSKCVNGSPAFTKFSLDAQGVLCSILNSAFNTQYARAFTFPEIAQDFTNNVYNVDFIDQAGVGSCGYAGLAAMMVKAGPLEFFNTVFDLYCFGEFRDGDDKALPKDQQPRDYLLKREDTPSFCDTDGADCMMGATYLFVTSVRDATNAYTLSLRNSSRTDFKELEKASFLPSVADWGPNSFGSSDDDMLFGCSLLGLDCKQTAGACGNDKICNGVFFNHGLLPPEMGEYKKILGAVILAASNNTLSPKMVKGDSYVADLVREVVNEANEAGLTVKELNRQAFINSLPVPVTELVEHCSNGAMLKLNSAILDDIQDFPEQTYCGYGAYGCGITIPRSVDPDHFTYLQGCDKDRHICYLWSWGATFKIRCDILAIVTQSIISGKLNQ